MRLEEFLALPMTPSIRLRYGPSIEDAVEIDEATFERRKQELIDFCSTLPNLEGMSWQLLRLHTEGNGLMAKVLIALGELAGLWKMYPRPEWADLWQGNSMYPCIRTVSLPPARPKLVSDIDSSNPACECCGREMRNPKTSKWSDLLECVDNPGFCEECTMFCDSPIECALKEHKEANPVKPLPERAPPQENASEFAFDVEQYLKNFDGNQ